MVKNKSALKSTYMLYHSINLSHMTTANVVRSKTKSKKNYKIVNWQIRHLYSNTFYIIHVFSK